MSCDSPEEQLSKLRSPRTTSKATRSSSTFSPSGDWDEDWRNSAPHCSNRSSCSQRTEASPDGHGVQSVGGGGRGRTKEEDKVGGEKQLLHDTYDKISLACRSGSGLN